MGRKNALANDQILKVLKLKEAGKTNVEIGKIFGLEADTISRYTKLYRVGSNGVEENRTTEKPVERPIEKPVEKTLKDYTSRQLIKELWDRGYRIEGGELIAIVKKKICIGEIIATA